MRTNADRGGGGSKKWSFCADVLYGRPITTDNAVPRQCFSVRRHCTQIYVGHRCGHVNLDSKLSDNVLGIVANIFNSVAIFSKKIGITFQKSIQSIYWFAACLPFPVFFPDFEIW